MRRCLLLFTLLLSLSLGLRAADTCTTYFIDWGQPAPLKKYPTRSLACSGEFAAMKATGTHYQDVPQQPPTPPMTYSATAVGALCQVTNSYGQDSNSYLIQSADGECENTCTRIEGKKTNITIGYHATPSDNLKLNPATKYDPFFKQLMTEGGGTTCIAGCEHFMYKPGADTKTWVSQVAGTNGLYRSSADVSATQFATPCGGAPAEGASPSAPIPECNGVLGQVNGATVCLPRNTDTGVDLGGLPDATRGNPPAGEVPPGKDDKERAPGPGGAGNGSGTGGASNGGGASGGPATGSNNKPGGKGCNDGSKTPELPCSGKGELDADGNTDKPEDGKEQAACGAPGQPKCRIDESGTPGSVGDDKYLSKLDPYKSDSEAAREQIKSVGTGIFEPWAMLFSAPPLATCEGFDLPSRDGQSMGTIDPCNVVDGIRTAMAYIWAIAAFWLCLGWVKSANQ